MKSGIVTLIAAIVTGGAVVTSSAQTQLQPFSGQAPEAGVQLPAASEKSQAAQEPGQVAGAGSSGLVASVGESGEVSAGARTEVKSKIK